MHPGQKEKPRITDALDEALRRHEDGQPPWRWFDRKVRGHMEANAGIPSKPVPPPMAGKALGGCLAQPATRPRTIYVHVPFCKRICTFCAFFRKPSDSADLEAYTEATLKQIERLANTTWAQQGPPFSALYFGGGTPTALEPMQLVRLITAIRNQYPLARNCEVTVECRFDGLDEDYLHHLRDAGVNRLSFGVQSFDTTVRQSVGRIATSDQLLQTIAMAHVMGFEGISLDLIYNLPGQPAEAWMADVMILAKAPVTAASVYALIPMRGSTMVKQIETGKSEPLGDTQHEYDLFATAHDVLTEREDWQRFSFHHFGHRERETNIYNSTRSGGMDTLGIGCGAGGVLGPLSYMNPMDIAKYIDAQTTDTSQGAMAFMQPPEVLPLGRAYQLTEGQGISRRELLGLLPDFEPALEKLIALELVRTSDDHLTLTREGCFWGYNITALITEAMSEAVANQQTTPPVHVGHPPHIAKHPAGVTQCSSSSTN